MRRQELPRIRRLTADAARHLAEEAPVAPPVTLRWARRIRGAPKDRIAQCEGYRGRGGKWWVVIRFAWAAIDGPSHALDVLAHEWSHIPVGARVDTARAEGHGFSFYRRLCVVERAFAPRKGEGWQARLRRRDEARLRRRDEAR